MAIVRIVMVFLLFKVICGMDITSENEIISEPSLAQYSKCIFTSDFIQSMACATARALKVINEINKKSTLQIIPGITLISDNSNIQRESKFVKELVLPSDPKAKVIALMEHLLDQTAKLVTTRSLKLSMPESGTQYVARALEEGRGKKKKLLLPIILAIAAKLAVVIPIITGGLGLLASKALVISKIALAIAVILLIPTIFGSAGGGALALLGKFQSLVPGPNYNNGGWGTTGGSYGVPYGVPFGGGSPWTTNQIGGGSYARTFTEEANTESNQDYQAQELAYSHYTK